MFQFFAIGALVIIVCFLIYQMAVMVIDEVNDYKLLKTVTSRRRGTSSERRLVLKLLKYGVPVGAIFHDLYVKRKDGSYSQIDLVVATKIGILVFEVKDYNGWIFGNAIHRYWTQILNYGKNRYQFYNPIMQNQGHIKSLKEQLPQFDNIPFFSIIVFDGDCILKRLEGVPNGVFVIKSSQAIEVFETLLGTRKAVGYSDKHEIIYKLKTAVENGEDREVRRQHRRFIESILNGRESGN